MLKRNSPPAIRVSESYRERVKHKIRILANISKLPLGAVEMLRTGNLRNSFDIVRTAHFGYIAAGVPMNDARIIAYSEQFVDDSNRPDSERHHHSGLLYGIATAHHDKQCVLNSIVEPEEQRRDWVPFHFLPEGKGSTLEEQLLCVKDSEITWEMCSSITSTYRFTVALVLSY